VIITHSKHGYTKRDRDQLVQHLLDSENAICQVAIGNSIAGNLAAVVNDMRILRDASSCKPSFHHLSVNPALDHRSEVLTRISHRLRLELDPRGARPWAIVIHGKARVASGPGVLHAHLVVSHVDDLAHALDDSWIKIRTERLARELEWELGEPATLGRHHATVLKHLRQFNPTVANWLVNELGETPDKPKSAMSSSSRRRAQRKGISLPYLNWLVREAWSRSHNLEEFRAILAAKNIDIAQGKNAGVWVAKERNGSTIGSLERILRLRPETVVTLMEQVNELGNDTPQSRSAGEPACTSNDRTRQANLPVGNEDFGSDRGGQPHALTHPDTLARARSHRSNSKPPATDREHTEKTGNIASGRAPKAGYSWHQVERQLAMIRLRSADVSELLRLNKSQFEQISTGPMTSSRTNR
jgi:hypothetical protein